MKYDEITTYYTLQTEDEECAIVNCGMQAQYMAYFNNDPYSDTLLCEKHLQDFLRENE